MPGYDIRTEFCTVGGFGMRGTVSKEAFQTEAVFGMDQCRQEEGPTGYKTVAQDSSLAGSGMDWISRRLFV